MKRFTFKQKLVSALAVTALAVGVGGAAYGFWSTTGSGDGNGSTGTASAVDISATIPQLTSLGDTETFDTILTNNNPGSVSVAGETLTLTSVDCTGGVGADLIGAPSAWFTLGGDVTAPAGTIAGGGGTATISGTTLTINDSVANQDSCQSATITAHFSLS